MLTMWLYWSAFAVVMLWTLGISFAWALNALPANAETAIGIVAISIVCVVQSVALAYGLQRQISTRHNEKQTKNHQRGCNGGLFLDEEWSADYRADDEQQNTNRSLKNATWAIFIATGVNVVVAGLQWKTLQNTDDTLRGQQRAWIEPYTPAIAGPSDDKKQLDITFRYRNVGKEPATEVVIQPRQPFLTIDNTKEIDWYRELPGRNPVCKIATPNENGMAIYPIADSRDIQLLRWPQPFPDAESVLNQTRVLIIQGCVGYKTNFQARYAAFCYYWSPSPNVIPSQWPVFRCLKHNETF